MIQSRVGVRRAIAIAGPKKSPREREPPAFNCRREATSFRPCRFPYGHVHATAAQSLFRRAEIGGLFWRHRSGAPAPFGFDHPDPACSLSRLSRRSAMRCLSGECDVDYSFGILSMMALRVIRAIHVPFKNSRKCLKFAKSNGYATRRFSLDMALHILRAQ